MVEYFHELGILPAVKTAHTLVQWASLLALGLILARKMGIKLWRAALMMVATVYLLSWINPFLYWLERGFQGEFRGGHLTRSFIFLPLVILLLCYTIRQRADKGLDLMAVVLMLNQSFAHVYCLYVGCTTCRGYPMANGGGVYNPMTGEYLFPVQLLDGITAFLIFLLMILFLVRRKYDGGGVLFPILLISHGIERFFWDFFRSYEKVWLNLTALQFWAIGSVAVGLVWLSLLKKAEISAWLTELKSRRKAKNTPKPKKKKKRKKKKR